MTKIILFDIIIFSYFSKEGNLELLWENCKEVIISPKSNIDLINLYI